VETKVLTNQTSIFSAYEKGLSACNASPNDIIIFCHDDIQILSSHAEFLAALAKCLDDNVGIVGPAGTTLLGEDAVWWNHANWHSGYHRGEVMHSKADSEEIYTSHYGVHGQVVVLDGLFLAARQKVWEEIGLSKPEYYEGDWDFYDLHYTSRAHLAGYKNYTIPIKMIHKSGGSLVGRDSWVKNRDAFKANTELPLSC
jgi:GT2 family glycosyltransferase